MPDIFVLPKAEVAIEEIGIYIAEQSQSLETVRGFLKLLEATIKQYALFPKMGKTRSDLGETVRAFTVQNYIVLYRPLPDGIEVLYVCHTAQDIPRHFRPQ